MKPALSMSAFAIALLAAVRANAAEPISDDARADALFTAAKQLVANNQVADACPMFAESKRLAPGVGVSLHLADCYERLGRTASAWQEFDCAERAARTHGDEKRAIVAERRALALEPKLERLTITTTGPREGWQVLVDGVKLPSDHWNAALAMDPGDHTVVVDAPGTPSRTLRAHLDPANNAVTLRIDDGIAPVGAPAAPAAPPAASPAPATTSPETGLSPSPPESSASPPHGEGAWRTLAEVGCVGLTAAGVGFGSFFMLRRAHFIEEGPPADPTLTNQATTAATISFVASGVALTSAFVLFFTTPSPKSQVGWIVSPTALPGGAGASVVGTF